MGKKILILISALLLMSNMIVSADVPPTISLSAGTASAGQTVEIDLSLANNTGIVSMMLSLDYDQSALKLIAVSDKKVLGTTVHGNDLTAVPYTLCWANDTAMQNYMANGVIATLTFEVSQSAEAKVYPISVTYDNSQFDIFDVDLNTVDFAVSNGSITVENKQGVSVADVTKGETASFKAYLSGEIEGTVICAAYSDKLIDIKTYPAAQVIDVLINSKDADYIKVMWWDLKTLAPYCENVIIDM